MKRIIYIGILLVSTLLLVGCGSNEGACCEDEKLILSNITPKGGIVNEPKKTIQVDKTPKPIAPTAIAHANDNLEVLKISKCQATVNFDANSSYDSDGNSENLSYLWKDSNAQILSDKDSFTKRFVKKGAYEITLIAIDEDNLTSIDRVCVLVNIDETEIPLVAKVSGNLKIKENQNINLSARAICRDDISKYEWRENDKLLSSDRNFVNNLKAGTHTLTLTIEDNQGNRAVDIVDINVASSK
jgi:hypothetical protein